MFNRKTLPTILAVLGMAVALAAGCQSEPEPPKSKASGPDSTPRIQAVNPRDMALETSRRPMLQWRLPSGAGADHVSVGLREIGRVEDPRKEDAAAHDIGFASNITPATEGKLDPFNPASGVILTGEVRRLRQLAPQTWYKWRVRAISGTDVQEMDFYFKTRSEDAVPPAPTSSDDSLSPLIPPMPQPVPPQPIDNAGKPDPVTQYASPGSR
jgi:hypothetical protein